MVTVSIDYIHGDHLVKSEKPAAPALSSYALDVSQMLQDFPTATRIDAGNLLGKPVYEITTPNGTHLIDAQNGRKLSPLPQSTIETIARKLYAGPGPISSMRLLTENPPSEIPSRVLPIWQVNFDDPASPTLYISPSTGNLISKRHDFWRAFDFVWMLHIMDYDDRSDVNNWLLRISATLVTLASLTGMWLLLYSFNKKKNSPAGSKPASRGGQFFRFIHKWLGLVIGLQVAIWSLSGLVMSLLAHDTVSGHDMAQPHVPHALMSGTATPEVIDFSDLTAINGFHKLSLRTLNHQLVYQITDQSGTRLVDARSGQPVIISEEMGRVIATNDYSGSAEISAIQKVLMPTSDTPRASGPAWKVAFDDSRQTALYISAETGNIVARRNDTWRIFDIATMLHFMDYPGNNHFNNPWIIVTAFAALWLALSGIILLFQSFTLNEFKAAWMKMTGAKATRKLYVLDPNGGSDNTIETAFGTPVYNSLANGGIELPSSCGGGGTCGLCRVKFTDKNQPVLEADRHHFSQKELAEGYRLSCQHRLTEDVAVELPQDLLSQKPYEAEVVSTKFLTPTIKEIKLRLQASDIFTYRAGGYMLVDIPTGGDTKLKRAYSLATPSAENPEEIVFNIRQIPAPEDRQDLPMGIGSTYMCNLKVGEKVNLSGPFGHFSAKDSDKEMVFIGGGAGMAPLRAIIRDQLLHKKTKRKISFWYGVRNAEDIFYQEEFDGLVDQHENLNFQIGLSEPKETDNWDGPTGYIHEITMEQYLANHPDLSNTEFYLCGPPAMLAATLAMLRELGIDEDNISFDDFGI